MTARKVGPAEFCRRGHDLREPGSYYVRSDGRRNCRICRRASIQAWRAANPGGVPTSGRRLPEETRAKISAGVLRANNERRLAKLATLRATEGGDAK